MATFVNLKISGLSALKLKTDLISLLYFTQNRFIDKDFRHSLRSSKLVLIVKDNTANQITKANTILEYYQTFYHNIAFILKEIIKNLKENQVKCVSLSSSNTRTLSCHHFRKRTRFFCFLLINMKVFFGQEKKPYVVCPSFFSCFFVAFSTLPRFPQRNFALCCQDKSSAGDFPPESSIRLLA